MGFDTYFADSYLEARQNFLTSCLDEATLIKSWQHPLRGMAGEKLYVDLAWFGSLAAQKVLILLSATHGVEGFGGSGIQVSSLKSNWHKQADNDVAIVMIHGLNPWGMSYCRRVNEDGVDLNRNFLDFGQPLPKNSFYNDLADIIVPSEWTIETQRQTLQQLFEYLYSHEFSVEALAQGQYSHWYAPFYGGEVSTWSNRIFQKIFAQYFQNKQAVGLLDYHTGLGQYATGQLMGIANNARTANLAATIWGDKLVMTGSANSVAVYKPHGTLIATLQNNLCQSICLAAAYEFGTIPETEVFDALRADHWLYYHGDLNSNHAQIIRQGMIDAFYNHDPDWQESICHLAFTAQAELLAGLKSL